MKGFRQGGSVFLVGIKQLILIAFSILAMYPGLLHGGNCL